MIHALPIARRLAVLAAALALAVRLLVPAGFMPMAGAGVPALVLCGGAGPMAAGAHMAISGMGDHSGTDKRSDMADHGCPFAAMALAVDLASPPPLLALAPIAAIFIDPRGVAGRPGIGLAAPPPPKTGPPILS